MLARRAALVVTDYFPTFNVPRATRTLRRAVETPVVAVDSATVVPVKYHDREYPTAPPFRTRQARAPAHFGVTSVAPEPEVRRPVELPFDLTVPDRSRVPALVGSSRVDHSVAPVAELGGGTRAAHRRLEHFLTHGLPRYAEDRADPNADATSGLSPYLHFGNISPREVLLRAQEAGPSEHVAKFRDELLTWRELAFNFAHFNPKHRTVEALPGWAREELARGEADPRPAVYSSEELEQARTAEPLWNAAQRAYVRDGWMPNPLRVVGESGGAVDPQGRRGAGDPGAPEQQVCPRRTGPEHVSQPPVGARPVRPPLLPATDFRDCPLDVAPRGGEEVRRRPRAGALRLSGAQSRRFDLTAPEHPRRNPVRGR